MKYGIAFSLLTASLAFYSIRMGGAFYLLLWPALSFALVSSAYFGLGTAVFGKRPNGVLSPVHLLLLGPYIALVSLVWHAVRLTSREPAYDQLTDNVFIGRRLLSHERPSHFDHIVDLTCEFNEPLALRRSGYTSIPILDGHYPDIATLREQVTRISELDGDVFIHCAQGHGRTATIAIAYLIHQGISTTVDEAVDYVLERRPDAHLGRSQYTMLRTMYDDG